MQFSNRQYQDIRGALEWRISLCSKQRTSCFLSNFLVPASLRLKNVRPIFTAETPRTQRQRREGVSNRIYLLLSEKQGSSVVKSWAVFHTAETRRNRERSEIKSQGELDQSWCAAEHTVRTIERRDSGIAQTNRCCRDCVYLTNTRSWYRLNIIG